MLMRQPLALETSIDLGHAHTRRYTRLPAYAGVDIMAIKMHVEVDLCLNADMDLAWQRLAEY